MMLGTLELPDSLLWSDEHASHAVAQTMRRALDGSPVIYYARLDAGRPITLESAEDSGWLTKSQVDALEAMAASPGAVYTLILRAWSHAVMFRHHEPPAFEAQPLWHRPDPQPGDWYRVTIRLITV